MLQPYHTSQPIPFYRNVRVLGVLAQAAFAIGVIGLGWLLLTTMQANLQRQGIPISFTFLQQPAGFAISEGLPFQPSQSYLTAFGVGVVNTLRAAVAGIILATVLGIGVGVARLSRNWLLERLATLYVETFRNVPLLLWLVFTYAAIRETLPRLREGPALFGGTVLMSNRGIAIAWPQTSTTYGAFQPWLLAGLVLGCGMWLWTTYAAHRRGGAWSATALRRGVTVCVVLWVSGFVLTWATAAPPLVWSVPRIQGFNYQGGIVLSPEFAALLFGLVVYTASFIAEIVRAGILAVPKGQREAAQSLGLSERQIFVLVIFPQALRVIIPPLINQYLNLTKNSSLAIAVGYPDLFSVGLTINNQTGQAIPFVVMIMVTYLSMSLLTSWVLNLVNRRLALKTR
jgi:general L-amino acid transport system permease protein